MKLLHMRRRLAAVLGAAVVAGAVVAASVAGTAGEPDSPATSFLGGGGAAPLMVE